MPQSKEEKAAYQKKYLAENKEKRAATRKKYYAANKEKIAAHNKEYRAENKERIAGWKREWSRKNPEKSSTSTHTRRALKKGNGTFRITQKFMRNLYNSPCVSCGASERIEADHIIPISKGGRHSEGNLHSLCRSCNSSKHTKLWIEFIAEKKGSKKNMV